MKKTLSIRLFETLQQGKERLGKEALFRVTGFVESQRLDDSSFCNKSGESDLYYTSFGWVLSYVLGIRQDHKQAAGYLAKLQVQDMDLVHYAAWCRCRMIQQLQKRGMLGFLFRFLGYQEPNLKNLQGYPNNDPHSPYSQYIRLSLLEDTGTTVRNKETIIRSIDRYRIAGGGYANRENGASPTTNATVAALAVRGQLIGYGKNENITYLRESQDASGGFYATQESPVPDLLSTATALFMLKCYEIASKYAAGDFIDAHWLDTGGFAATLLEECSDVEYTFYGLLALGAL